VRVQGFKGSVGQTKILEENIKGPFCNITEWAFFCVPGALAIRKFGHTETSAVPIEDGNVVPSVDV